MRDGSRSKVAPMTESPGGHFADSDPEYIADAADDIDVEVMELVPDDPKKIPKDQGDIGTTQPPKEFA
jgi:hypothetical protein